MHRESEYVHWRDELKAMADWIERRFPPLGGRCPEALDIEMRERARQLRAIATEPRRSRNGQRLLGTVQWIAMDITDQYRCTEEEAEEFLDSIEDDLKVEMIQTGWVVIRGYCEFRSLDDDEDGDEEPGE